MEANNTNLLHSAVSLIGERGHHMCYSFSEIILESAVYMPCTDHLL